MLVLLLLDTLGSFRLDKDVLSTNVKNGIPTEPGIPVGKRINQSMGSNQWDFGKDKMGDVL